MNPASMQAGVFKTLAKTNPAGALQARKLADGSIRFYWRFTIDNKTDRKVIGTYDPSLPPKSLKPAGDRYSVVAAQRAAEALASQHYEHRAEGGLPALEAARKTEAAQAEAARRAALDHTLKHLLDAYCDQLEKLKRRSHTDARSIFKHHVYEAWPVQAARPANSITDEEVADMMRRCMDSGKDRTGNKLRSYIRAAYQMAKDAKVDAAIPLRFKAFAITHNPAAETKPKADANRADKNPLSLEELRAYWRAIRTQPGVPGAMLRLHLLTGGQRIEQLVKVKVKEVTRDGLLLWDAKGRPGQPPRKHLVPLIPQARAALDEIMGAATRTGEYALSTDGGSTHINALTVTRWAQDAAPPEIEGMQPKRVRSGVETLLARSRVGTDTRGRLQSHGITGVQAKHYDAYDYLEVKDEALRLLYRLLTTKGKATVTPIEAGRARKTRRAA